MIIYCYPGSEKDRYLLAASLSIVKMVGPLTLPDHLDILLLSTHPNWCINLLHDDDLEAFRDICADAGLLHHLFVGPSQSVSWMTCLDYLKLCEAITIIQQVISIGKNIDQTLKTLPSGVDAVIEYSIRAFRKMEIMRHSAASKMNQGRGKTDVHLQP